MAWNVKPAFALIMDTLPLCGLHYRPYMIFFGTLGAVSYALVAVASANASFLSDGASTLALALGLNGMIWKDIAIDGVTLAKMKQYPEIDVELPTLQNVDLTSVSVIFSFLSGFLIEWIGLVGIYAIISAVATFSTCVSIMLEERRDSAKLPPSEYRIFPSPRAFFNQFKNVFSCFSNRIFLKVWLYCFVMQVMSR